MANRTAPAAPPHPVEAPQRRPRPVRAARPRRRAADRRATAPGCARATARAVGDVAVVAGREPRARLGLLALQPGRCAAFRQVPPVAAEPRRREVRRATASSATRSPARPAPSAAPNRAPGPQFTTTGRRADRDLERQGRGVGRSRSPLRAAAPRRGSTLVRPWRSRAYPMAAAPAASRAPLPRHRERRVGDARPPRRRRESCGSRPSRLHERRAAPAPPRSSAAVSDTARG